MWILNTILGIAGLRTRPDDGRLFPVSPEWLDRISLATGVILVFLWVRALFSVIGGWNDPAAKHLRIVSCILLVPFGWIAYVLVAGSLGSPLAT